MQHRAPGRAALCVGVCVAALMGAGIATGDASPQSDSIPPSGTPSAAPASPSETATPKIVVPASAAPKVAAPESAPPESTARKIAAPDSASPAPPPGRRAQRPARRSAKSSSGNAKIRLDDTPVVPPGLLHIIVSIERQSVTLFADGRAFATSTISSGTPDHPTPMGVFSVIQKNRRHVSNLYGAPMPYMQRLTWSGTAMHQGPLPGRPASHGCIRLPKDFAELLWKATRIGARVIVAAREAAPIEIEHERLFVPRPQTAQAPAAPPATEPAALLIKTADATEVLRGAVVPDAGKPAMPESAIAVQQGVPPAGAPVAADGAFDTARPASPEEGAGQTATGELAPDLRTVIADPLPPPRQSRRKPGPISIFVSRKEGKLYVRRDMEPVFEAPIILAEPDRPIGTHVYTAMGMQDDGERLRWTVVSIPSHYVRLGEPKKSRSKYDGSEQRQKPKRAVPAGPVLPAPVPSAREALERIAMPPEAAERIAALVSPGASLIVSDNRLSDETGRTTDFIVLTP